MSRPSISSNASNARASGGVVVGLGVMIELIGPDNTPDDVAARAGTIGYEILTSLGPRYHRVHRGA